MSATEKMTTIIHSGRKWRLQSETKSRLVFTPDASPILEWRRREKLNQRDAAKRLNISQPQLARIESGSRTCPPELLNKIR